MKWNNKHRRKLFNIINWKWGELAIGPFEDWLASLGIKWEELDELVDPPGTIAVHEGPGFVNTKRLQCWIVPDDVALKLLFLETTRSTRNH